jgi:hypothetical protein
VMMYLNTPWTLSAKISRSLTPSVFRIPNVCLSQQSYARELNYSEDSSNFSLYSSLITISGRISFSMIPTAA